MFDPSSKSLNTHLIFPRTFDDHQDSGVCSPPLWKNSPPPHHKQTNHQNLSSVSKAQAIARGQRELMEMVSKMPESCYELSLKDLVEVKTEEVKDRNEMAQRRKKKESKVVRKVKSDRWVYPVGANGGGFLLKMVFPVRFGGMRKTKKKRGEDDDGSVRSRGSWVCSPRASVSEDKDWWKTESGRGVSRMNSGSSKSSGGGSSRSNSDRSRGSLRDEKSGCLSFLRSVHARD